MSRYLLDTNSFITPKNLYYPFSVCPAFWDCLVRANEEGRVASIEMVLQELLKGEDELASWARQRGRSFFLAPDDAVQSAFQEIAAWIRSNFEDAHTKDFLSGADGWLIAHAKAHHWTVVTLEVSRKGKKIKIPDVCRSFQVPCINLFEMLKALGAKFVLSL